jgi:hypothetical protein
MGEKRSFCKQGPFRGFMVNSFTDLSKEVVNRSGSTSTGGENKGDEIIASILAA